MAKIKGQKERALNLRGPYWTKGEEDLFDDQPTGQHSGLNHGNTNGMAAWGAANGGIAWNGMASIGEIHWSIVNLCKI